MATKCTVWDILSAAAKYDGSPTAHTDVVKTLIAKGHSVKMTDAWCTETVMAILYDAGGIGLVGGFTQTSGTLKSRAEKLGIWKKGSGDILPGDIVIYGTKEGKPNHTELALGSNVNLCGNYAQISKDTCQRRKRSGRTIIGRIRPKYAAMPAMNNLQRTIAAVDCMLNVYGSSDTRKKQLSVFGSKNIASIQAEIDRVWGKEDLIARDMAVYVIAGRAGKDPYRKTRLGKYADKAQARVELIYAMRGKNVTQAAKDVINDNYGKDAVRNLLLSFCGYDAEKVQAEVNRLLEPAEDTNTDTKFRIHMEHFCRKDESAYGACTAIFQYAADGKTIAKCILIDTAMDKTASVVIEDLKAQGVKQIDALFISHAHGDHYGGLTKVAKAFPVKWLYLPDPGELDKYQKSYGDSLRRQAKKVKNFRWYKQGDSAVIGEIKFRCLYAPKAKDLREHDSHHYVNNMSPFNVFECGQFVWHTAGDAQNPANNLFVAAMKKAGVSARCHGLEFHWHTDGNACNAALMEATKPKICCSNYHHPGWHSGRKGPKKKAEAVGAVCYATADDGHIEIDIIGRKVTVSTSKSGKHDTYTI